MSTSDLIVGFTSLVCLTVVTFDQYASKCWLRLFTKLLLHACNNFSVLMIALIAFDRFLRMKYLERYLSVFPKRRGYILAALAILASITSSTIFVLPLPDVTYTVLKSMYFSASTMVFAIIFVLYYKALRLLKRKASKLTRIVTSEAKAFGKAAKMIAICLMILVTPWILLNISSVLNTRYELKLNLNVFMWFSYITFQANAFCSSVIFISQNRPARRLLNKVIGYPFNRRSSVVDTGKKKDGSD